jgi:AraC family transcriptional regulator
VGGTPLPERVVDEGVLSRCGRAGSFHVGELEFPPGHEHPSFDPELPYVGVVVEGALVKQFPRTSWELEAGSVFTIPAGASHSARFSAAGARVALVWIDPAEELHESVPRIVRHLRRARHQEAMAIGRRLSVELALGDATWDLAAEGLALELLAVLARDERGSARPQRPAPRWLDAAEELLHPRTGGCPTLAGVAASVGVHPAHLARVFRAHHGMSVGQYARTLRLDWAAHQLAADDSPLAVLALEAGFCDQSHFTRAFKRHTGLTPSRYRELARANR